MKVKGESCSILTSYCMRNMSAIFILLLIPLPMILSNAYGQIGAIMGLLAYFFIVVASRGTSYIM